MTRTRLQSAALELFGTHGYDGVTSAELAQAAGVTERTFFRYFPTKDTAVLWYVDDDGSAPPDPSAPARAVAERAARWAVGTDEERQLMLKRTALIVATPTLRAQWLDKNHRRASELADWYLDIHPDADPLETRVTMTAVFAASCVAAEQWADDAGRRSLDDLLDTAFAHLAPPPKRARSVPAGPRSSRT